MASEPVRGIEALNRAFALADSQMKKGLPVVLKDLAEPVRTGAERRALAVGVTPAWSAMRKGSTRREVYIAPEQRGTRIQTRRRPAFANFLLGRAMIPALDENREEIGRGVDALLERIERQFNRG